jgi:hypothetical protein
MRGSPVTDDESAYRFAAELLGSGRLWAPSPPMKIFFDRNFMINDGRLYPGYFLGWPALLAPAIRIGYPWVANPVYSALTIPPLFAVLRRVVGSGWARGGVLLFLSSPFIQVAAATGLSHTSCLLVLTCCLLLYLRTRGPEATGWDHAGFATAFSVAFWIRPYSAVSLGLPLLVLWALDLRRFSRSRALTSILWFAAPAAAFGMLFLTILWLQTGSPWLTGYARYSQYVAENGYSFTTSGPAPPPVSVFIHFFAGVFKTALGLFRLNFDLFGWPSSFALTALAYPRMKGDARVLWAMVASALVFFSFQADWGIDSFGPVHSFELSLPVLVLSALGARRLHTRVTRPLFAPGLLAGLVISAQIGFVPVRFHALHQITAHVEKALEAPKRLGLHNVVIFTPLPFAPPCGEMPRHFVHFMPVNDPDLQADILWVNDIGPGENRLLLREFPDRQGYVMRWSKECAVELTPIQGGASELLMLGPGG